MRSHVPALGIALAVGLALGHLLARPPGRPPRPEPAPPAWDRLTAVEPVDAHGGGPARYYRVVGVGGTGREPLPAAPAGALVLQLRTGHAAVVVHAVPE
jgi:hypothetical protein